jgi:hypothetical protein
MFKFLKFTISVLQNLGPLCSAKRVDISGLTFKVSPGTNLFIFFYSDSKPSPFISRQHLNEKNVSCSTGLRLFLISHILEHRML